MMAMKLVTNVLYGGRKELWFEWHYSLFEKPKNKTYSILQSGEGKEKNLFNEDDYDMFRNGNASESGP